MSYKNIIVDANNLLHKLVYGTEESDMRTKERVCTLPSYRFLKYIRRYSHRFKPERVILVWDGGRSKRRKSIYDQYKVRNNKTTEEFETHMDKFNKQKSIVFKLLKNLPFHIAEIAGREGDDLCCLISSKLEGDTVIVSEDRDFYLLIDKNTSVYHPSKELVVNLSNFKKKVGCSQKEYLFVKTVKGDTSDSIGGVENVGEKTCFKVLDKYGEDHYKDSIDAVKVIMENLLKASEENKLKKREMRILEESDTVIRNIDLMDITKEEFTEDEIESLSHMVFGEVTMNKVGFIREARSCQFEKKIKSFTGWLRQLKFLE